MLANLARHLQSKHAVKHWLALALACLCASCITINIYFPAAAAEKAADQVIDQVLQAPEATSKPTPAKPVLPASSNQEATSP